jgi:hypothetical protein
MNQSLCVICGNERGIFQCNGCGQGFCLRDTNHHRQELTKQLDELTATSQLVQELITRPVAETLPSTDDVQGSLLAQVNEWERTSVEQIRQVAELTRKQVLAYTCKRAAHIQVQLDEINDELQRVRQTNDFLEMDLRIWKQTLDLLKQKLTTARNVTLQDDFTALVTRIRVHDQDAMDFFERSSGDAIFDDNGRVVTVPNGADVYTEVRGYKEYTRGTHTIRFKVENLVGWILFGIIHRSSALHIHSYNTPSCYGWYNGQDFNYAGGQVIGGQGLDAKDNDTVELTLDCDQRCIRLTNGRTKLALDMNVDVEKCPFPWQVHLNLNGVSTRIRIL